MNNEQLQNFLDSHGADPGRWPAAQRATIERLIAQDAQARTVYEEARRLDALLSRGHGIDPRDERAAARVLAKLTHLPRQKRPFWHWPLVLLDWQFAPAWPRMAALAGFAAIGFMVGLAGLDRAIERYDSLQMAAMRGDITSLFEPEALTGARP